MMARIIPGVLVFLAVLSSVRGAERPVIYQLMVRTFGNTNETRKIHGTLEENGCGKFADLTPAALDSLRDLGFTHLWLTGVLEQASGTAYPGRPADDPDILKGIAGSPYAIRDYFDVCPDYAMIPAERMEEFKALLERCHRRGLKVIIDFVPNHVARSYGSDVRPERSFGRGDDRAAFFEKDNNFFYLPPGEGPPLELPAAGNPGCDGRFPPEARFGRVTGNNVVSWKPSIGDWYETVKLNYGHDFTSGRDTSHLPGSDAPAGRVPRTWRMMDGILAYWQGLGVDGFRCDMAHMVPLEFWQWSLKRCRARDEGVFFCAEAYDSDPAKLTERQVLDALLDAGFDAVYDDPSYDVLEALYEAGKWANDLDAVVGDGRRFHHSLRYAENHDEVRLANPGKWGGLGMKVGKPVTAVLFALGRGPVMLYSGQEVGEPAIGAEGFGGDDARTTIFDYWSMPEFAKWVNGGRFDGGRLSADQKALRAWYGELVHVIQAPAFTAGGFHGLNAANLDNAAFGRLGGETASGHWLYAFLRHDRGKGQSFLVIANFHGSETLHGVKVRIPRDARDFLGRADAERWSFTDRLDSGWSTRTTLSEVDGPGLALPDLAPCSALLLELGD
ncbi:alpha-amylase family glycosyl hydrolase [Haloferula sargassicola]|uniref:Alpha-1,4-glucan:maltose-1-phosphate maltosyltransferase n=1 Tax=Haloferula sargassicola TaxID=490096 RepID=A0ABP9UNZ7_9BACT